MSIDFSPSRWDSIHEMWAAWRDGTSERPMLSVQISSLGNPGRARPDKPLLTQACALDFSIPVEDLIDRLDFELSERVYLGAAFPSVNMTCFGPGVIAAFCGARMDDSSGNIWFHPPRDDMPIEDIHFEFNPDHPLLNRILGVYHAGHKRWKGQVQLGLPDLGGNLDLLAHMRTSEALLMDLYDSPKEVDRCMWEIHDVWWKYFDLIQKEIQPENHGCTTWLDYFSAVPTYTTQCDLAYMISPHMFSEHALPELAKSWEKLAFPVYHLDGIGQLPHLPLLLENPKLEVIQWVPGEGQANENNWPEVYQAIAKSGKKIVCDNPRCVPQISRQTGMPGIVASTNRHTFSKSEQTDAMELLRQCGY